ncbi:filamentous hemagglutinin N-terminal domain-containing protein [Pseudomonas cichorii]|nr:filamentous hemagglutinin N-terminal domain-containing protein [Pseudomonas cichorii]
MDVKHFAFLARQPSAGLQQRERFWGMPKRGIALILANAMFWQPLWAQADGIVVSSGSTSVGAAGNGVPIINIAAPNGSGLSHNQFQQYNVGSQGVILNNATAPTQTQSTQLGGIIISNSNLQGSAATTILNEVVSNNRTELKGYTEVAGQAAKVIVANPYGITCDGCGFINTPQATLTTGKPMLDGNGNLTHFNVQGGSVSIEGAGLNADNLDQFDIITRSARVNAELHAKKLNIIAGRNDVDAQTLNTTALADDGSAKPTLAIDSSALGGMYAGAVKLVGTEAGVGVRLASNVAASAGDIQIDANGHLSMTQMAASGAVTVNANSVEANGPLYAGSSLTVTTPGDLTVTRNIAARDTVNLSSSGQLKNSAIIEAGVNADNSRNTTGDVVLAAKNLTNTGSIVASRALQAEVTQTLNNQGATLSGQASTRIVSATLDNRQSGRILSQGGSVEVTASGVSNGQKGLISSAGTMTINAASLDNQQGVVRSTGASTLTVTDAVVNRGGEVLSDASLTLNSGSLDNSRSGRMAAKGVMVTTGAFDNSFDGRLTSTEAMSLTAAQVNNSEAGRIASAMALTAVVTGLDQHSDGRLYSNSDVSLDLSHGHLNNQDGLITAPGQLLLNNLGTVTNQSGEISSAHAFTLAATALDNTDGTLLSDQALIVRVDKVLTNLRGLVSGTGVELEAGELDNTQGSVSSDAALTLDVTGQLSNHKGLLSSAFDTTLNALSLNNTEGQVMADQVLTVILGGDLDNQAGTLGAGQGATISAVGLDNRQAGAVLTDGQLDLILSGTLDNRTGGQVQAKGILNLTSQALNNQGGRVVGQDLLTVHSGSALNRGGVIRADKLMTLLIGDLDNSQTGLTAAQKGVISSKAGLELIGTHLNNQSGLLNAVGVMTLQADTVLNGAGRIASQSDLTATVGSLSQHGGELVAQGTLTLSGQSLDNQAGGLVGATKALKLVVDDIDNRAGEISSQVGVEIIGDRLDNSDGGKVLAGTALQLVVERIINQNKGLLFGQTLNLEGHHLDNAGGTLASQQDLTIVLTRDQNHNDPQNHNGALNNSGGLLSSEAALTVTAESLDNTGGTLSSAKALKVTTTGALINEGGSITTDTTLTLVSDSLDNRQQGKLSGQGATSVTTGAFDNSQGGQLTGGDTLELIAGDVINQSAGRIASALALTASVTRLDQQGGELFSNTTLSLDLNHGQLNNQGGLINSPGALLLKNLKGVDNQGGEISSALAFTLAAQHLDNSAGKLLSNQALTLDLVEFFSNLKGSVSATGLNIDSASLDNGEGLISSRGDLKLTVDKTLSNVKGTVIADGDLEISAASGDNTQGQISSQQALIARIGNLQQAGGQLFALSTLNLTGDILNNSAKGFVGAGEALTLTVDDVDNQGGEISTQQGITLTGQTLNNNSGQILAQQALTLDVANTTNHAQGVLSGKTGLSLAGISLDNTGGVMNGLQGLVIDLSGALDNSRGAISSEGSLQLSMASLTNSAGSVSSAGKLTLDSEGAILNQSGELVTDDVLELTSASLDNSQQGVISGKGLMTLTTGDLGNSQKGRISSGERLDLTAATLTNRDGGSIGSQQALVASVSRLDQQKGSLFSNTSLSLDLNHGELDNRGGLINAPGTLLLKNLKSVLNQGGEISSAQAFTLKAQALDNSGGAVLSNQRLTLRIDQALSTIKGMIAAAGIDATAGTLDNTGGTLTSRNALDLTVTGLLTNRDQGLINAAETLKITSADLNNRSGQLLGNTALTLNSAALDTGANGLINSRGTLTLTADSLTADNGGEVSALGNMTLVLDALSLNAGRLLGEAGLSIDLNGADLHNRAGLISAQGPLTLSRLRDVNNQGGEISSAQSFTLAGGTVDNSGGKLISSNLLTLNTGSLLNQNGLISGWQGLDVTATSLDNRSNGTLSSRSGAVDVELSGALLNSGNGALVSQKALSVTADSLDNSGGILSSAAEQTLTVTGLLNNSQKGLIDSGAGLVITAAALDNTAGTVISKNQATLDLIGALTNTGGQLASGASLLLKRSSAVHNQGGQLVSQGLMTLNTGLLDNSNRGTVASNGTLLVLASGKVLNNADGLIYSQTADVQLEGASLDNAAGAVQSQSALTVKVVDGIDNQSGRLIAQNADLYVKGTRLDSRGGVLSSLKGLFTAQITGVLRNGYALNTTQGGVIQAQRLNLTALGGFNNYGGRVSASTGEALITTANFDNRNGGLYAKGLVRVIGHDFDNSGDNDGQIAGGQVNLQLTGALNNRLGIIESDSTLAIRAASLDNQTGQIRSLGTSDTADFQIGTLFDNSNGTVEVANSNLILNAASFLNTNGNLLQAGTGTFDISTANLTRAGGNVVTRGGLTLTADSWTNNSVIQAGRLTVNVGTFNQTASGQLLASSAFVGTGGSWTNDGLIASDGTLSLNLSGGYAGSGRTSSLGTLGLTASQLALTSAASIASGARAELNISGLASNYGRITSAADLIVNAGSVNNYGTLGATQNLTFNTASLLNSQGVIFSGGDMRANVGSLTNLKGDFYALNNLTIKGYGVERANQVSNISGSMESGGDFSISATAFENRTEGSDGKQDFSAGRTLVKGIIAMDCVCHKYFEADFIVREFFEGGQDTDVTASALLASGRDFTFNGDDFLNNKSTISAVGNVIINSGSVRNIGTVGGAMERTRVYRTDDSFFVNYVYSYNQRNNPDFPNIYYVGSGGELRLGVVTKVFSTGGGDTTYEYVTYEVRDAITSQYMPYYPMYYPEELWNEYLPVSLYDRNNLIEVPEEITRLQLLSDVEKVVDGNASAGRSAVIQSGGDVSITATQNLQNSVIRQDYVAGGGTSKVQGTSPSGTGTTIIRVNAQLSPDLSQQQVNPLTLPGFSLPTGQNGLFRLSTQTGNDTAATQATGAPQSWTLGSASVSVAQREQTVSDAQARVLQFGTAGQVSTATRQLADVVRQNAGLSANASAFDSSAPADSANSLQLIAHSSDSTGVTRVNDVQVPAGSTSPSSSANAQVLRVQALPGSTTSSSPHKYLIETNPVLTDLRQFMSSDYLLANLGYDPDESMRRLGDGFYEQRLVQQAIVARTGQAFLAGQTSNEAQFKYLMNNAIASKEQLSLAVGVSLTSRQVAALTHDIVWLEEHEVNGEKVLVPVLYLAQANNRLAPNGALIAGNDVTLIAGEDLDNVGTLRATNNLSATAGNDLVNVGLIEAGNRLDLLAGNDLVNKAGGILYGRDVTLTATRGDVINERTVIRDQQGAAVLQDFADSAARIESVNDMTLKSGRDINNIGGTLQAGRDLSLISGRDVYIGAAQTETARIFSANNTQSSITQLGSSVSVGRDLMAISGRDINVVASDIDVKRDIAMAATENMTISSAADETHSLSRSKKLTVQTDHVKQVSADLNAGGSIALSAGQDLAVISSRITAGEDATLKAGESLSLLAAQDSDYYLYDKKSKGSFGAKKTKRSEVTDVRNVGSEITTGGDLTLSSEGDQLYQAAKLTSGNDLTIESGGGINFEGVKDLHQESHTKSSSSLVWTSMKGKGRTDETLRQTEMVAQGELAIRAVEGLKIDIKQVDQQTVSQTIDAMVQADPQLAWLKEAEKRGDVDWRQVKELHDSFKYSSSSLGQGAMLAIMIIITVVTAGAGTFAAAGTAAGSAATGAATAAGFSATTALTIGTAAHAAAVASLTSLTSQAAISTINNKGNLGAALKDTFSSDSLKGALVSGLTAGFTAGVIDPNLSGTSKPFNNLTKGFDLSSLKDIGGFAVNAGAQGLATGVINTAINGGSLGDNLTKALVSQAGNVAAAVGFYQIGSIANENYAKAFLKNDTQGMALWAEGGMGRTALHAMMGGAISSATGGDFATGAVAAGASQAMAGVLNDSFKDLPEFREAASKIVGLTAAGLAGGDIEQAAWIAGVADQYNRQLHPTEIPLLVKQSDSFAKEANISPAEAEKRLAQALLYYTDAEWNGVLTDRDVKPDALTLKHLGIALSPLGSTYAPAGGDVPAAGAKNTYTPAEVVGLITNYRNSHTAEYVNPEINAINLQGGLLGDPTYAYADFYRKNLASPFDLSNAFSGQAVGMYQGGKNAVSDAALSVWALLSNPAGVSEQVANGLMGLSKDPLGSFVNIAEASQTQEAMATLYDMQGNSAASAAIRAQSATEFALNFLPTNRAKAVAELSLGRKLGSEGPCCFAAGTMVSTPDGDRAIDTLKVGDIVWSKPERGGKPFAAAILATHVRTDQPIYRLKLKSVRQDGQAEEETLLVTPGHPFYVPAQRDFVPVIDLKPGDRLQSLEDGASENTSSEVESLELYLPEGKTYNLTVDVGHTFYVGKLKTWVHNTGPCVLPEGYFGANVPKGTDSGASSAANAARLKMQMVAEQAAGARAPTQITSYSNHALEQFAGRDGGIGVSQSALSGAWSSPLKIEYVPSKYGPTFRYTGTDAVIVVNAEGKVVTGWGKSAAGTAK